MKRILSLLLVVLFSVTFLSAALLSIRAEAATELYYDGAWHTYTGNLFQLKINEKPMECQVPPVVFQDYSVVPARDVFEELGAEVLWREKDQRVIINYDDTQLILTINNRMATKNGIAERMQIAPKIINGKTMIPARYVSESLGFGVDFDSKTDTILITSEAPVVYDTVLESCEYNIGKSSFEAIFDFSTNKISYSAFSLKEPDRVVVDIQKAKRSANIVAETQTDTSVTQVRFGQHDDTLRIAFDLNATQKYKVSVSGDKLKVSIENKTSNTQTEEKPQTPTVQPSNPADPTDPTDPTEPTEPEEPEIVIEPSRSITIDPGHGGSDPGACFVEEDGTLCRETDINLSIALKVRDILLANDVEVVMTRTKEKDVVRRDRPELANTKKTALFISIHTNSVENNETANGIETWGSLETSKPLAGVTDKTFARNVQNAVIKRTKANDRGIKDSVDLTVLKYSVMPSVLIEVGFITNKNERGNLYYGPYKDKLAQGIAEGILKTFDDMGV